MVLHQIQRTEIRLFQVVHHCHYHCYKLCYIHITNILTTTMSVVTTIYYIFTTIPTTMSQSFNKLFTVRATLPGWSHQTLHNFQGFCLCRPNSRNILQAKSVQCSIGIGQHGQNGKMDKSPPKPHLERQYHWLL